MALLTAKSQQALRAFGSFHQGIQSWYGGAPKFLLDRHCELRSVGRLALERKEQNKQDGDQEENIQSDDQRQVSHDLRFRFWN